MNLYGAPQDDGDKKTGRVTVALTSFNDELIEKIADEKNMAKSEIINLLIEPTIQQILRQEKLIKERPIAVAFDLATKD
jgi:hypothetical protein